ncbi:MAG: hypothetical protein K2J04_07535 [Lachnospiraceae bacterium]|nr:hypothetical protein [Lachnospiraceae bacterium]
MGATEEIIKMAKENNGTVTSAMVVAAGFSRGNIKYLVSYDISGELQFDKAKGRGYSSDDGSI